MDFNHMCRICLSNITKGYNLFENLPMANQEINIADVLVSLTQLDIDPEDQYPQQICQNCFNRTTTVYEFGQKCIQSSRILKLNLGNAFYLTEDRKQSEEDVVEEKVVIDESNIYKITMTTDKFIEIDEYVAEGNINENVAVQKFIDKPRISCTFCTKSFTVKSSYTRHRKIYHPDKLGLSRGRGEKTRKMEKVYKTDWDENRQGYPCRICNKTLKLKKYYDSHMKFHMGENKKYGCDICGKEFNIKDSVRAHMNIHSNRRPYECDVCGATFRQTSSYKLHKQLHTGKKYKCEKCDAGFVTKGLLTDHNVIVHEGVRRFKCDICSNRFFRKSHLDSHMFVHRERPFLCSFCSKEFSRPLSLKVHLKDVHQLSEPLDEYIKIESTRTTDILKEVEVDDAEQCIEEEIVNIKIEESDIKLESEVDEELENERNITCSICKQVFSRLGNYNRHVRIYHPDIPIGNNSLPESNEIHQYEIICTICENKYSTKRKYTRHLRKCKSDNGKDEMEADEVHEDNFCTICKKKFKGKGFYKNHIRKYHSSNNLVERTESEENPDGYLCQICHKTLKFKKYFDLHMKVHMGENIKLMCEICGKQFNIKKSLRDHMNIHTNTRPYTCQVCGATFSYIGSYKHHRQLHTGKKFRCEECNVGFVAKAMLAEHNVIAHEGVRRFKCDVCPKSYFRMCHLNNHRLNHRANRFACNVCNKEYMHKESLRAHQYLHTGKPFSCSLCSREFVKRYLFKNHLKNFHHLSEPIDDLIERKIFKKEPEA